ncbi:hypothetical protein H8356DRAFT_1431278 [Neocallimastix lanati (nom. inval.)]|nr:hypothetical protein H8356DRAFT_1431278 [Neocallimastix sp. JGI-2020a]
MFIKKVFPYVLQENDTTSRDEIKNISYLEKYKCKLIARSQVKTQDLKLEKNTTKISNAVDNMCATIVVVNNIDHSYIKDDIAIDDLTVNGIRRKALIDSCSNLKDPFYDILINLKTQVDNKLFIHPILYSLCQFNNIYLNITK